MEECHGSRTPLPEDVGEGPRRIEPRLPRHTPQQLTFYGVHFQKLLLNERPLLQEWPRVKNGSWSPYPGIRLSRRLPPRI